jgi:lipopolysaccharide export system protein LptA
VRRRAGAAALLMLLLAAPAYAQLGNLNQQDSGKPLEILADQGIEWRQNERVYIARGNAKATRGGVAVNADTLSAYYRPSSKPAAQQSQTQSALGGGSSEIYRIVAEGQVRIATETQTVYGDKAVYDVDNAVIVVTGRDLRLVTPRDLVTARDSLEWYDQRQVAVARGDAVAIREDRRVRADVLQAQVVKPKDEGPSRISRVDAHGNVLVSTAQEVAQGATGVYNVDTGIVTLIGDVVIARGDDTGRGEYGVVDLNTNVSRLMPAPPGSGKPGRVEGLIIPRSGKQADETSKSQ